MQQQNSEQLLISHPSQLQPKMERSSLLEVSVMSNTTKPFHVGETRHNLHQQYRVITVQH